MILLPILGLCVVILIGGIVIVGPVLIIKSLIGVHNYKKEILKDFKKEYMDQFDVANDLVEHVHLIKDYNNNLVCAEELAVHNKYDENSTNDSLLEDEKWIDLKNQYDIKQAQASTTLDREKLEQLKNDLTLISFQMQERVAYNNVFLKYCGGFEESFCNKKKFIQESNELKRKMQLKKL